MKESVICANPYMPMWEHVPDGEPKVFEYNGETRVYLYGSHDIERDSYCGKDYVCWSAPVDDLTNWTCHGVCYETHYDSVLYAPDVAKKGDTYYMYAAEKRGSLVVVATSKCPWGPFTNPVETKIGFDPGVLVDDDGKAYIFWGFCELYGAELEDDMVTIKEGTVHEHILGHARVPWDPQDDGHCDMIDAFYEASSPRKINGKYVFVYSKRYEKPIPELGIYEDNNGFLSYKISDKPLEGYREGGDISFNGGEILKDANGIGTMTYQWGNNHGSIAKINGKWYVFYHRQTGTNEFSRQAMLEPVDVAFGKDGNVYIGDVTYIDGEPVAQKPVEMTSQGPNINGIDAYKWISAGYACHIYGGSRKAYVIPVYEKDAVSAPVVEITQGLTVGLRYLQFGNNPARKVTIKMAENCGCSINVRLDSHRGKIIASCDMAENELVKEVSLSEGVIGKHAVYFEFCKVDSDKTVSFDRFTFD